MKRITRKDLRRLYEPAPQSLYDGIHEALADLPEGKGKKKVKKKISTGFILAAALLVLTGGALAARELGVFKMWFITESCGIDRNEVDKRSMKDF